MSHTSKITKKRNFFHKKGCAISAKTLHVAYLRAHTVLILDNFIFLQRAFPRAKFEH